MRKPSLPNPAVSRRSFLLLIEIHESLCCYDAAPIRTFCSPASIPHFLALLLRLFVLAGIKSKALIFGRAVGVISVV